MLNIFNKHRPSSGSYYTGTNIAKLTVNSDKKAVIDVISLNENEQGVVKLTHTLSVSRIYTANDAKGDNNDNDNDNDNDNENDNDNDNENDNDDVHIHINIPSFTVVTATFRGMCLYVFFFVYGMIKYCHRPTNLLMFMLVLHVSMIEVMKVIVCIHTYAHTYICSYIHMLTHTYAHTCTYS